MEKVLFRTSGFSPEGIAWDGEALWVVDSETRVVERVSIDKGKVIQSFAIDATEPKGLTWDGSNIWVSDNIQKTISKIDINEGKKIFSFKAPITEGEGPKSIEGLAWDGKYLWSACYAGWSSKFFRVNPEDGSVFGSYFCGCNPRGLTSNGKHLWTMCYNGKKFPPMIDRRVISEKEVEMIKSRTFLARIPIAKDPTGLAFDGTRLLFADKATRSIYSLEVK